MILSTFALSQVLAGLAFIFDVLSFQFKERKSILICFVLSAVFIGAHFLVLQIYTSGILFFVSAVRFLVSYYSTDRGWMYSFMGLSLAITGFSYIGPLSILACLGTLIITRAVFQQQDRLVRLNMMVGTSVWIVHNLVAKSPVAVALEIFFLASNLVGYYRHYVQNKQPWVLVESLPGGWSWSWSWFDELNVNLSFCFTAIFF